MKALKKSKSNINQLLTSGATGAIGLQAVSKLSSGTSISGTVTQGVGNIMAQAPLMGSVMGAGMIMGVTKEAFNLKKKKL